MEGTLSQTSTRKKRPSATTNEIPTQRVESGPHLTLTKLNAFDTQGNVDSPFNVSLAFDGSKIPGAPIVRQMINKMNYLVKLMRILHLLHFMMKVQLQNPKEV